MRPQAILITLAVVITAGILAGTLVFRKMAQIEPGARLNTAGMAQPSGSPIPTGSGSASNSPSPSSTASPSAPMTTNRNPDLTTDEKTGLSRATVILTTTRGVIKFKFYPKEAPNTVKRIVELINQGFYNGLTFHRVVPGFVVQGGDPSGTGAGGSGQKLKAEFSHRKHYEGTVAMARAQDVDSADSQFYITLAPEPHLDEKYTIFGQVVEGIDTVKAIQLGDKMTSVIIE